MFSNEQWLVSGLTRQNARYLYDPILHPHLWEMGSGEAAALASARSRWEPRESYWLMQPSSQSALW